jgi:hypothetical protein
MHKAFAIHSLLDNLPLTLSGLAFDGKYSQDGVNMD